MQLRETGRFSLTIPEPFNFRLTVAKPAGWHWSTPGEIFENSTLWSGAYIEGKPVGLKMSSVNGPVDTIVYAEADLSRNDTDKLKTVIYSGLGGDEDLAGFYEFAQNDPVLSVAVKDLHGMRVGRLDDLFGRVILAILLQMAPFQRSSYMMSALLEGWGTRINFDRKEVILWPRPQYIAHADENELRGKARLGYRARRLIEAAQFLSKNPLSLLELSGLPEEEALKRLTEIPGIGKYSAGIIFGQASVPIDAWSVVVMSEVVLGRTPQDPRRDIDAVAKALSARWGAWGWMAFVYILNDLENLAKTVHLSRLR